MLAGCPMISAAKNLKSMKSRNKENSLTHKLTDTYHKLKFLDTNLGGLPILSHMGTGWITHESFMDTTWTTHGFHMDPTWIPNGSHMDPIWIPHGSHMDHSWIQHGFHRDPTWIQHGSHMYHT